MVKSNFNIQSSRTKCVSELFHTCFLPSSSATFGSWDGQL